MKDLFILLLKLFIAGILMVWLGFALASGFMLGHYLFDALLH